MHTELMSFHAGRWNDLCVRMAADAVRKCGATHEGYQLVFSQLVDERLQQVPEEHHPAALEVAYRWDYLSPEVRTNAQQET
jgi:hypothetical protein